MARKSRSTGVGRGNGFGSARTQYRSGMPSGNPNGRPRKEKLPPSRSFQQAMLRELARPGQGTVEGVEVEMPQFEAMTLSFINDYYRASPATKLRMLTACSQMAGDVVEADPQPTDETIRSVVEQLAAEYVGD